MQGLATVEEALKRGRGYLRQQSETPFLDSMVLLADCMNKPKEWLLAHPEAELSPAEMISFQSALDQVQHGVPVAYALGWREFYGRRFVISTATLIPRPETELLIEHALRQIQGREAPVQVLDVGTGSGCIGITLVLESQDAVVYGSDISIEALNIARENARRYGLQDRFLLVQTDLFSAFNRGFDLVCGNLPYVPTSELAELEVAKWEPPGALDGGEDGLRWTERAIRGLPDVLRPGGAALFEIGAGQADRLLPTAAATLPSAKVSTRSDLSGIERVLVVEVED